MIHDQSGELCDRLLSHTSAYLDLCNLDVVVRKRPEGRLSCYVGQPSKVGTARTITKDNTAHVGYTLHLDHSRRAGSRQQTLQLKQLLTKQARQGTEILSLAEAGCVILRQDSTDIIVLPYYKVVTMCRNSRTNVQNEWRYCLACNVADNWVQAFLQLMKNTRLQVHNLIVVNQGQVTIHNCMRS